MKTIIQILLLSVILLFSPLINMSFADDDVVKFKLEIRPNQQKVEAKIDGDEHKQIQIRAEYVKLNTITNNYHIKVTITNNSGQILYHQLALINKVEHSEVKYPDNTTDYIKNDDGKQITKTLPYYNYGNIKPMQATPREWYLSNTGKEEIEIEGYIISKEIPIVLDPKIAATNAGIAEALTVYLTALRNNDIDAVIATLIKPSKYFGQDLPKKYTDAYNQYPETFSRASYFRANINSIKVINDICYIKYTWIDPEDGSSNLSAMELQFDGLKWLISK